MLNNSFCLIDNFHTSFKIDSVRVRQGQTRPTHCEAPAQAIMVLMGDYTGDIDKWKGCPKVLRGNYRYMRTLIFKRRTIAVRLYQAVSQIGEWQDVD